MHLKISGKLKKELERIRRDGESDEDLIIRMLKKYSLRRLPDETREKIKEYLKLPDHPTYKEICHRITYEDSNGDIRHPTVGTICNIMREMKEEEKQ